MAGSYLDWSTTAATNSAADGDINWAEFQAPDTVNNSARQMMARVAEYVRDTAPIRASTGAANVYAVTTTSVPITLAEPLTIWFRAHQTNTAAATLSVNAFGSVPLRAKTGVALAAGEIQIGTIVGAYYVAGTAEALIINSGYHVNALGPAMLASNTFGMTVGDIKITASATADAGYIRLTEVVQNLLKTDYPDLNTWASGQSYPWGSTGTTFGIPPAAGYFLRFAANDATVDTGGARLAGITQTDQTAAHTHTLSATGTTGTESATHTHDYTRYSVLATVAGGSGANGIWSNTATVASAAASATHTHTVTVTGTSGSTGTGTETRAKNVAFHADMLAKPALVASGLIGAVGLPYTWDTGTTDADPGNGKVRVNNATPASATIMYISETGLNSESFASVLATWDDSTSTIKGYLRFVKIGTPATFLVYAITGTLTDAGTYDKFNLTYVGGGGTMLSGDKVSLLFISNGDSGAVATAGSATLANGLNSNIVQSGAAKLRLVGPSAVFSIGGFTAAADGGILRVYNTVAFAMTIVNEDASSTAANRLKTLTGANVTLRAGTSFATFVYDSTDARWILSGTN